ncbi:MAG: S-formylglutathione hydrolase, partial [Rhizobiales bacterium]|nr:S-formylglutathione hydrolase [Hyphomicrobiales bacterium]
MTLKQIGNAKSFGGWQQRFSHTSDSLNCDMTFSIYLPPQANMGEKVPVLYWLSGLTCSDENFVQKAAAQRIAAELGMAIVTPDTSPRGDNVPDDENGAYDFGLGAGFYLNATQAPWISHYQMYDYIVTELPALIEANFPVNTKRAISGHSMGGHGALTIGLKNSELYKSISAFSPICNPINCDWGKKAFENYLGENRADWQAYDASVLIANTTNKLPILVDQGLDDDFLENQLKPQSLISAAKANDYA